jgi:hypothetical protein
VPGLLRKISVAIATFAMVIGGIAPSSAAVVYSLFSWEIANKTPTLGVAGYEARSVGVIVDDADIDTIKFYVSFYNSISSSLFANSSRAPLVRVKVFRTVTSSQYGRTLGDIWIESPGTSYNGSTPITAKATGYRLEGDQNSGRVDLAKCRPQTWIENKVFPYAIGFSISRLCSNIGNVFSIIGYVDSDVNNSEGYPDFQWVPERSLNINLSSIPAPAKKAQTVTLSQQSNVSLAVGRIVVNATSSAGLPVLYSTSGANCRFENATSTTLLLTSIGQCTVSAYAEGDNEFNRSAVAQMSFAIEQVRNAQQVTVDPMSTRTVGEQVTVFAKSTSGINPIYSVPQTTSICKFLDATKPNTLTLLAAGTCTFETYAPESASFTASPRVATSFTVQNLAQQTFTISQLKSIPFENGGTALTVYSSSGRRILSSVTTSVCRVPDESSPNVTFISSGTCTIDGYAPASGSYDRSPTVRMSFTILPKKSPQRLLINQLGTVPLNQNVVQLGVNSDSGQWVLNSGTPNVCDLYSSNTVQLYDAGTCVINGYAPETNQYLASPQIQMSFQVVIIRVNRNISVTVPSSAKVGDLVDIEISSDSDDLPALTITTPKICNVPSYDSPYQMKMIAAGTCKFTLDIEGDRLYFPYNLVKTLKVAAKPTPTPTKAPITIGGTAKGTTVKVSPNPTTCANLKTCPKK